MLLHSRSVAVHARNTSTIPYCSSIYGAVDVGASKQLLCRSRGESIPEDIGNHTAVLVPSTRQ
eukprot:scaffold650436_cov50-Prasinocladus_malaysianus.AAC.1